MSSYISQGIKEENKWSKDFVKNSEGFIEQLNKIKIEQQINDLTIAYYTGKDEKKQKTAQSLYWNMSRVAEEDIKIDDEVLKKGLAVMNEAYSDTVFYREEIKKIIKNTRLIELIIEMTENEAPDEIDETFNYSLLNAVISRVINDNTLIDILAGKTLESKK